ncbi:MAG: hypothetical protein Q7S27_06500 [Nanoarchaeota archaeon]|nr:hypothetical protein [Nanoarchaeota archaeon]
MPKEEVVEEVNIFSKLAMRFGYLLLLMILTLTAMGGSFRNIMDSLSDGIGIIFLLFIIGFTISTWRFWWGAAFLSLATIVVNVMIFGDLNSLTISAIEIPFFVGIEAIFFFINKGYEGIQNKKLRWSLVAIPLVILLLLTIMTALRY